MFSMLHSQPASHIFHTHNGRSSILWLKFPSYHNAFQNTFLGHVSTWVSQRHLIPHTEGSSFLTYVNILLLPCDVLSPPCYPHCHPQFRASSAVTAIPLSGLFCFQVVNRIIQRLFEQPVIPVSVVIKNFIECHYLTVLKWRTVQQKQTQTVNNYTPLKINFRKLKWQFYMHFTTLFKKKKSTLYSHSESPGELYKTQMAGPDPSPLPRVWFSGFG